MKKMLFLMLFLGILGTVGTNAQVRIGGNGQPNTAAVLDLNATDATINGTKGLALPRVSLSSNTVQITSGTPNLNGMLVYNTDTTLGAGVYYWDGSKWAKVSDGSDAIVGNEITDTIAGGGLTRSGSGNAASPYKVGIKTGGVTSGMIADGAVITEDLANGAVTASKLSKMGAYNGQVLSWVNSSWAPVYRDTIVTFTVTCDTCLQKPAGWAGAFPINYPDRCGPTTSWLNMHNYAARGDAYLDGATVFFRRAQYPPWDGVLTVTLSCWRKNQ